MKGRREKNEDGRLPNGRFDVRSLMKMEIQKECTVVTKAGSEVMRMGREEKRMERGRMGK